MNAHEYWLAPQIDPIALSIGPLDIRWYGIMYAVGFLFALWLGLRRARASDLWTEQDISDLAFYCFLGVVLGGRLGSIFFYDFQAFLDDPLRLFRIWEGACHFMAVY